MSESKKDGREIIDWEEREREYLRGQQIHSALVVNGLLVTTMIVAVRATESLFPSSII